MHTLNGDPNVAKLQEYTIKLYAEIERSVGPIVRRPHHRRRQSRRHAGADGLPQAGLRAALATSASTWRSSRSTRPPRLFPMLDKRHFVGALVQPARRPRRSGRGDACVRQGRAQPGCGGLPLHSCDRAHAAPRRHVGRHHRQGNDPRRACRQRGRIVGAGSRTHGRPRRCPVLAMEHQYVITGEIPEVVASPSTRCCT